MKKFFITLLVVLSLLLSVYIYFFSVIRLMDNEIALLEDLRIGRVEEISDKKLTIFWKGAFPWWYSTYKISLKSHYSFEINIPLFKGIDGKSGLYSVIIPIDIKYRADYKKIFNTELWKRDKSALNNIVKKFYTDSFSRELMSYILPVYKRSQLSRKIDKLLYELSQKTMDDIKGAGFDIESFKISRSVYIPTVKAYKNGLTHLNELKKIDEDNEKKLKILKNEIAQKKIKDREYFNKLSEISRLIKDNPRLLDYLYIDKIGDNVRVILSDGNKIPFNLGNEIEEKAASKSREVDNLR